MNKKYITIFSTALLVFFLDHLTKGAIRQSLEIGQSTPIIKNIFHLTYITNTGSAFGLFKGMNIFFMFFSLFVIVVILYYIRKIKENEKSLQFGVGLLLGGTLGNLMDRLFHGYVVDFLDFRIWPVFNIADAAITVSVAILILILWRK